MGVNFLHALAAFFTMVMILVRQLCVRAVRGTQSRIKCNKRELSPYFYCNDSSPMPTTEPIQHRSVMCISRDELALPKYKRDPDIHADGEIIGVHPRVKKYIQ